MSDTPETGIIRDDKGRFVPGAASPNPEGRPEGSISPITRVRQIFRDNPDEFEKFLTAYIEDPANRKHIVEMLDGKPKQTIAGDKDAPLTLQVISYNADNHDSA